MPRKKRRRRRVTPRLVVVGLLAASAAVLLYALYSAHVVTEKMSGARWELPSRIFASPWILYPGVPLELQDLEKYFVRLGYVETRRAGVSPGQWKKRKQEVVVGIRSYRDATTSQPARVVRLALHNGRIRRIFEITNRSESEIYTAALEPELVGEIHGAHQEQRTLVRLGDLPKTMKEAILVMEDRQFYEHFGISLKGILRALWANVRGGRVTQGGSTLTQQLMKNFFLTHERTFRRKIREAIMTLVVEVLYSKDEIFEAYINEIYLGQRGATSIHGYGEAAHFYFSKRVDHLSLAEQALLVGLASSPGLYNPYTKPEAAKERRLVVLQSLFDTGKISPESFRSARFEPIEPRGRAANERRARYFADFVRNEISQRYSSASLEKDGYEVHTTLDLNTQVAAFRAVQEGLKVLDERVRAIRKEKLRKENKKEDSEIEGEPKRLQAAIVVLNPQTGAIKAMVGGGNYDESQFNRVSQARRQPGSAVKPFVAAVALLPPAEGKFPVASAATILDDRPATFSFEGKDWSPQNYDEVYVDKTTVRGAIERSLNTATVNLAARTGLTRLSDMFVRLGFEKVMAVPSLALGAMEVSPLGLARAYTVLASGGLLSQPQAVTAVISQDGERQEQKSMEVERVLPAQVAYLATYILQGVVDRGTGRGIRMAGLTGDLAGKTGTSDEYRDSWFVGFSPSLLAAVWVGYDDDTPTGLTGASGALPIWIRFMKAAQRYYPSGKFVVPSKIEWVEIDRESGCIGGSGERLREAFLPGTRPSRCP